MYNIARKYYSGDLIKGVEMGGACGTYGGEGKFVQDYVTET
jgi:hypothetical protein